MTAAPSASPAPIPSQPPTRPPTRPPAIVPTTGTTEPAAAPIAAPVPAPAKPPAKPPKPALFSSSLDSPQLLANKPAPATAPIKPALPFRSLAAFLSIPPRPPAPPIKLPSKPAPPAPLPCFLMAFHILSSSFSFSRLCLSCCSGTGSRRFNALSLEKLNLTPLPASLRPRPTGLNKSLASFKLSSIGSTLPPPPNAPPPSDLISELNRLNPDCVLPSEVKRPLAARSRRWVAALLALSPDSLSLSALPPDGIKRPFASRARTELLLPACPVNRLSLGWLVLSELPLAFAARRDDRLPVILLLWLLTGWLVFMPASLAARCADRLRVVLTRACEFC